MIFCFGGSLKTHTKFVCLESVRVGQIDTLKFKQRKWQNKDTAKRVHGETGTRQNEVTAKLGKVLDMLQLQDVNNEMCMIT